MSITVIPTANTQPDAQLSPDAATAAQLYAPAVEDRGADSTPASPGTFADGNSALAADAEQAQQNSRLRRINIQPRERGVFSKRELREGVVLSVGEEFFRARLVDPEDHAPDEEVDIEIEQVDPADMELLKPGALFFWAIGYLTMHGTRQLVLRVTFRRRPHANPADHDQITSLAAAYLDAVS